MSNDTKSDLPEQIVKLAKSIGKELKFTDTGVGELPKDTYEKHLPEGLTLDMRKQFQAHDSEFIAALALAHGEASQPFLKKHKDLNETTLEIKAGKDTMGGVYSREKTVTIPGNPVTQKVKYGQYKAFVEVHAGGPNRGALKKVRDYLSAQAEAAAKS